MSRALGFFLLILLAVGIGPSDVARAAEPVFEFLQAARERGYGEVALDYLEQLRSTGRMPPELAEALDLELSRSYLVAAGEAFNAAEADERRAKAEQHLNKFLSEHPDHPELAGALETWGDLDVGRALQRLRLAGNTKDAQQKQQQLTAARAELQAALPRYEQATARFFQTYSRLKSEAAAEASKHKRPTSAQSKQRRLAEEAASRAELDWLDCRFKRARLDYYLTRTYADREAPERKAALQAAAKAFDEIFQGYRATLVGLHAHLWHGRAADELGQDQLALDIYDEVLATAPEGHERDTGLEPLFAEVQSHRLNVLQRLQGVDEFLKQAQAWLESRRQWRKYDGYQGVALAVAKTNLGLAAQASGEKKARLTQSALSLLADVARQPGEHQPEAILLRRQHTQAGSQDLSTVKTFDEALALGQEASDAADWPAAVAAFARALELKSTTKSEERLAQARARLDEARYRLAADEYAAGKFEECLEQTAAIMAGEPESAVAPAASSLAVSAALALYIAAEDKPAALERLIALAQRTIQRWPDKPEADDARIALGHAELVQGNLSAAIAAFESVNPRSQRRATALFLAGQTHWRRYLSSTPQAGDEAQKSASAAERALAAEQLSASLDLERQQASGSEPTRQMLETQLLLAEIKLNTGESQAAAELLLPLVAWIEATKPAELDTTLVRVLLAAVRADVAIGQQERGAATADLLAAMGPDGALANGVLVTMLQLFGDEWQRAEAELIAARTSGQPARISAAETAAKISRERFAARLAKLVPRKQQTLAATIYLADSSARLGQTETAGQLYQLVLDQAAGDAEMGQRQAAALTRVRAQLIGLLRQQGKFADGLREVDQLIAAHPNALEPKMEKGRLLQAWAEQDPAYLADAIAQWTMLRTRLARVAKKPPEYYEVVYNAAWCLFQESLQRKDPAKALQAEQLLNATLVLSPQLNGPEMVARYRELLQQARQQQGRPSAAK